uniref:Uncharacterized protein n=1 Tax=Anopheles melas TaxID=34690 RepID=A0A182TTW4_9DIPT
MLKLIIQMMMYYAPPVQEIARCENIYNTLLHLGLVADSLYLYNVLLLSKCHFVNASVVGVMEKSGVAFGTAKV